MEYGMGTKCLHLKKEDDIHDKYGAVSFPIYQTATFEHISLGNSTGYDYSRLQNPTRDHLERLVAAMEGGVDAIALTSGMAAITCMMEIFEPGDHIIIENDLYGGTVRLFDKINKKNGLEFSGADLCRDDIVPLIKENTKAIYCETPTNPMMNVADIAKLNAIAKEHGLLFIVDNTFLSPYLQNPIALGADIVIHSGTKYLGGHNDTIAGFLVAANDEIKERLRYAFKTTGSGLTPFDSWLIERGMQTLAIRMDKAQSNAMELAQWLLERPKISRVIYPGLKDHPGHEVMKKQSRGFGAMLTFEMQTKEQAVTVLNNVSLIHFAESLGGAQTLLTYPITQTHADVPKELLDKNGITDRVLRLSVGIEDVEDLKADLLRVFDLL